MQIFKIQCLQAKKAINKGRGTSDTGRSEPGTGLGGQADLADGEQAKLVVDDIPGKQAGTEESPSPDDIAGSTVKAKNESGRQLDLDQIEEVVWMDGEAYCQVSKKVGVTAGIIKYKGYH